MIIGNEQIAGLQLGKQALGFRNGRATRLIAFECQEQFACAAHRIVVFAQDDATSDRALD